MFDVILESDLKLVIRALKSSKEDCSCFGLVVEDCKALISGLNQCQVNFVYRSANAVAHSIARAAASVSGQRV